MIMEAQKNAARVYSAGESYFLVNGSTGGIYSMILGVTKPGDKIIVQRNCHRSVFMACLLGGLEAAYINPTILEDFNIAVSIDTNEAINIMNQNSDAKAIVLTYPTYYGTCMDLERIATEAHKRGMLVLVDEAHGAHMYFNERLPRGAMECGADIGVTSMHKTTPALTQTALLNIRKGLNSEGVRFMLRLFQSTSPSYIFMASIDAARHIMEHKGKELLDRLLDNIDNLKYRLLDNDCCSILGEGYKGKSSIFDIDPTKIVIHSSIGGKKLDRLLRTEYGIQAEMSDVNNIVFLTSLGNDNDAFERLYNGILEVSAKHKNDNIQKIKYNIPSLKTAMNMRDAYYKPKVRVKIRDAEGRISGEIAAPYPPGIPILLPGEIITSEIIEAVEFFKANGININGMSDLSNEYIDVVEI
jgi:arginine/lysine/ornithine decarboxylase